MADQQFCLRWNNHQSTLISVFDTLLENGTLVDCTLAAEGQYLKAHKVVLCACSPYLETLLSQHYEKHPIVILKDVKFSELKSMMDYMYRGEVNISQDQLGTFLKAAESLQIKGLSDNGADGDARDVGSTSKVPQRKPSQSVTTTRSSDAAPESPAHRSRDGSISPTSRKRRRIRRNSQGDDSNVGDSHLDTSNSCDLPSQAQSIPIVPNIPATVTSSITTTPIIKTPIIKPEQTEIVNRIDPSNMNSLPPESGLLKEKIEPSEPLLEPKTEYLEDVNTEDSVEDLTLDDDDEMDGMDISNMSNMSNMSRPGPSHGNDLSSISNQGFAPWQLGGNQSGTDEVFMAAQEAVSAHRDSQDFCYVKIEELYQSDNESKICSDSEAEVNKTISQVIPAKSRKRYEQAYDKYQEWCKQNCVGEISEKEVLAYFSTLAGQFAPTTLNSLYSMIRSMILIKRNVDISKFKSVIQFLKKGTTGYTAKKSKIFTKLEVKQFLLDPDDRTHLFRKVVLVVGLAGACRRDELTNLSMKNVKDIEDRFLFTIHKTDTKVARNFLVTNGDIEGINMVEIVRKYINLRPADVTIDRFFLRYSHGLCYRQPVGVNTIACVAKHIATHLKLKTPQLYSGNCFRRTSMLLSANPDAEMSE